MDRSNRPALAVGYDISELVVTLEELFAQGEDLQPLWNTLFWFAIIFMSIVTLHVLLCALYKRRQWQPPGVLAWPRPEVTTLACMLPIIVAAGAGRIYDN